MSLGYVTAIYDSFLHLIFPQKCLVCENELSASENHICSFCSSELTHTNFHLFNDPTPMDQLFWGRIKIHSTYTHLFFEKNKASQKILFNLKYKNNSPLGEYFGERIGDNLLHTTSFNSLESIIPVPLHSKKKFIRGYNQSESIAKGISSTMNIPMDTRLVVRSRHSETQTKKSRFERWDNVQSIFEVSDSILQYKHIALVDDVITTGSTIESIAQSMLEKHPSLFISVITLAIA